MVESIDFKIGSRFVFQIYQLLMNLGEQINTLSISDPTTYWLMTLGKQINIHFTHL